MLVIKLIINSKNFKDLNGLALELKKILTKDVDWIDYSVAEWNGDSIGDFLQSGFGVHKYKERVLIYWNNSEKSKIDLGDNIFTAACNLISSYDHVKLYLDDIFYDCKS